MCATFQRENREVPYSPVRHGRTGRIGKAKRRNPMMNEDGKSDEIVVPTKRPNEGRSLPEEAVEGRVSTMGNVHGLTACRTQRRDQHAHDGLACVREVARRNKDERFTALLHHVTVERLGEAFSALSRSAAPGVDGVTWDDYARNVGANLRDLHARVQSGRYRAKPSRRVMIPKPDGGERPLGIAALEDKIVQRATAKVLNAVYETDFVGFSYGFRRGGARIRHWTRWRLESGRNG